MCASIQVPHTFAHDEEHAHENIGVRQNGVLELALGRWIASTRLGDTYRGESGDCNQASARNNYREMESPSQPGATHLVNSPLLMV